MEYIAGTDLSAQLSRDDEASGQRLPGRPAPLASVVRWGIALCRTLEYLAACEPPVVHQDIKPANLILARDSGELYLVDFGAARLRPVSAPGGGKTAIFGTPGYAAPEQFQGRSEPRSDVYALAATLYHLATDDDPGEHLFDFPRLAHLGYLGQILRGALQPAVEARPTATELRVQLEAAQRVEGSRPLRTPDGSVP
jgi:serine/threonine protein kinase